MPSAGSTCAPRGGPRPSCRRLRRARRRADGPRSAASTRRLSLRHAEILLLLAAHPRRAVAPTSSPCCSATHDLSDVTVRAEVSRLRRLVGPLLSESRPVPARPSPLRTDVDPVRDALAAGDIARRSRGVPRPGAAAVRRARASSGVRDELSADVRAAVLAEPAARRREPLGSRPTRAPTTGRRGSGSPGWPRAAPPRTSRRWSARPLGRVSERADRRHPAPHRRRARQRRCSCNGLQRRRTRSACSRAAPATADRRVGRGCAAVRSPAGATASGRSGEEPGPWRRWRGSVADRDARPPRLTRPQRSCNAPDLRAADEATVPRLRAGAR